MMAAPSSTLSANFTGRFVTAENPGLIGLLCRLDQPLDAQDFTETSHELAVLFTELGHLDQAACLYHRALAVAENALGRATALVATTYFNLAKLEISRQRYSQAGAAMRVAYRVRELLFGKDHPDTQDAARELIGVLQHLGRHTGLN